MDFSTDIDNGKITLSSWDGERKVGEFCLTLEEARALNVKLMQAVEYLEYKRATGIEPYGKAPIITGIEHTPTGILVHTKKRD